MFWGEIDWRLGELVLADGLRPHRQGEPKADPHSGLPPAAPGVTLADLEELAVLFAGRIFNRQELAARIPGERAGTDAALLASLYRQEGHQLLAGINGGFAVAIWEKGKKRLLLARDHLGIQPLYYFADDRRIIFASTLADLFAGREAPPRELDPHPLCKFLAFNYNPGQETFFKGMRKLPPAHFLEAAGPRLKVRRYWLPAYGDPLPGKPQTIADDLLDHLDQAVMQRVTPGINLGIFLSGGLDSSTVCALLARSGILPRSFSYTCRQKSFDESHYARSMARQAGVQHQETIFSDQDILRMPQIVRQMSEPFCDVGINVATHLLGLAAKGAGVELVFTGDGGDELFAGHPVYEADKLARFADWLPVTAKDSLCRLASRLPDSDRKKNWMVMAKRFGESLLLPPDLLTHRWRVFYHPDELKELLDQPVPGAFFNGALFQDVIGYGQEVAGDWLERSLYCDYRTVVDFYLRRNDLNRHLGIETCFPLLDYRLVDYCARIPSGLKIKSWFNAKYILKQAVKEVLPADILHRKDKLGHSIPLKNWLRGSPAVKDFTLGYLADAGRRGLFRAVFIDRLIQEHLARRRNNSHRLWGLAVLEMWLQEHYDRPAGGELRKGDSKFGAVKVGSRQLQVN